MRDPIVFTDLEDYAPGSTAYITASGFTAGSSVTFRVQHAIGAGADGIWGTIDDEVEDSGGAGHTLWSVTDGVRTAGTDGLLGTADDEGDLDGLANGVIQTAWYVDPDDSGCATFLLKAVGAGLDGLVGTADDEVATDSFTDNVSATIDQ